MGTRLIRCAAAVVVAGFSLLGPPLDAESPPPVHIVFVSRSLDAAQSPQSGESLSVVHRAEVGKLLFAKSNGEIHTLVDATSPDAPPNTPLDVLSPESSYDGMKIVFSGFSPTDQAWRIYEIRPSGLGLRQITQSDRQLPLDRFGSAAESFRHYDDLDPCYLPDGRICFVSTRYPESVPEVRARATNLYIVNADGSDTHRITSERFGADSPTVDPETGDIVYSRWWRTPRVSGASPQVQNPDIPVGSPDTPTPIPPARVPIRPGGYYADPTPPLPPPPRSIPEGEVPSPSTFASSLERGIEPGAFSGVNSWFPSSIRPDGTGLQMLSGFHLDRQATQAYMPSFRSNDEAFALFLNESPIYGVPGQFGARTFRRGIESPTALGGPQTFVGGDSVDFVYSSVAALPGDGGMLITGGPQSDESSPGRFDVFIQQPARRERTAVYENPDTIEMDAVPVMRRPLPPIVADRNESRMSDFAPQDPQQAAEEGGTFVFLVENIFANAPVDFAIPSAPPMGQNLAIEFYMLPQRTSFPLSDSPILLKRGDIPPSGRVEVELPASVPLFEVLRRVDGTIPVGRDGQVFHVGGQNFGRAYEVAVCVGCHVGHSRMEMPLEPALMNLAPSAGVSASSVRTLIGNEFRPELLVDRRTDFFRSEWAAENGDTNAVVRFRWNVPIRLRYLVVYGAKTNRLGARDHRTRVVQGVTVSGTLLGQRRFEQSFAQRIAPEGTRLDIDGEILIESLELRIDSMSGKFEGISAPALAEVEIYGTALENATPDQTFLRGDADCNGQANLTDAVTILDELFGSGSDSCCSAAADTTDDRRINLSDPVFLLNHLFRGGLPPAEPFPTCSPIEHTGMQCDSEVCG